MKKSAGGPSVAAVAMEVLFQKNLVDLVKGLRSQAIGEQKYLSQALADVRKEMKSTDTHCKAVALQKLTYLQMLQGADMGWASFQCVEVMSSPRFAHKELAYLAACQSFHDATEVMLLITNLLRKDLGSPHQHEAALALNCLACVATPDLARDLTPDVFAMLNSTRLYVRKRATLALLRMVLRCPEVLKTAFRRLVERLEDTDEGVVRTAVNVMCELAARDPRAFLPLAPEFHRLLTTSSNNWMLIKLVKLFKALAPLEPRLGRKLCAPLSALMQTTAAKSLLFECIRTITEAMPEQRAAVNLCILKLREFVEDRDPNIRYLGLRTLASLMAAHGEAVAEHKVAIVECLDDADPAIQGCALQLLGKMVKRENLVPTVAVLLRHMRSDNAPFCNELVGAVLAMGGHERYARIVDFPWYLDVLVELACVPGSSHGEEVARQLVDIAVRAEGVREEAVEKVRRLLLHATLLADGAANPTVGPPLAAAAWITGEYAEHVRHHLEAVGALLQPKVQQLAPAVQAMYVQAVLKVFLAAVVAGGAAAGKGWPRVVTGEDEGRAATGDVAEGGELEEEAQSSASARRWVAAEGRGVPGIGGALQDGMEQAPAAKDLLSQQEAAGGAPDSGTGDARCSHQMLAKLIQENIQPLAGSRHMEVQERVGNVLALLDLLPPRPETPHVALALGSIFKEELKPVAGGAQQRVPVPEGLELEANLDSLQLGTGTTEEVPGVRPTELQGPEEDREDWSLAGRQGLGLWEDEILLVRPSEADLAESRESARASLAQHRARHDPFYLSPTSQQDPDQAPVAEPVAESGCHAPAKATFLSGELLKDANWGTPKKTRKKSATVVRLDEEDCPAVPPKRRDPIGLSEQTAPQPVADHRRGERLSGREGSGMLSDASVDGSPLVADVGGGTRRAARQDSLGYEGEEESGLGRAEVERRRPKGERRHRRRKDGTGPRAPREGRRHRQKKGPELGS